jgi:tetratricopeptide (TPR) repeat protein
VGDQLAAAWHDGDPIELGRRIRDRRLALSMTQSQLAGPEVTVSYISKIESGQRRPDLQLCTALAARLETSAAYLITGVEPAAAEHTRLALRYAELALESGEALDAERQAAAILATASPVLPAERLEARYLHARAKEALGELGAAIGELEQLVADHPDSARWLAAAIALSRCLRESGDLTAAIEHGEEALRRAADAGIDSMDEAVQLSVTVAYAYHERGETAHAIRWCEKAIVRADQLDSATARASAYWNASVIESEQGATGRAIPLAERALALLGEGNDARNLARLRLQLGIMLLRVDPPVYSEARDHLERARDGLSNSSASMVDIARCDTFLARVCLGEGELAAAESFAVRAEATARNLSPSVTADVLAVLGQLAAERGDSALALDRFRAAVAELTAVGSDRGAAQLWLELGALLDSAGDSEAARDAYRNAAVSTGLRLPGRLPVRR